MKHVVLRSKPSTFDLATLQDVQISIMENQIDPAQKSATF